MNNATTLSPINRKFIITYQMNYKITFVIAHFPVEIIFFTRKQKDPLLFRKNSLLNVYANKWQLFWCREMARRYVRCQVARQLITHQLNSMAGTVMRLASGGCAS